MAVRIDDRRRLEVVGRDALALHVEHRRGDVAEAAPGEDARNVEAADPLGKHAVAGDHVPGSVTVRQVA